jgi:outer membrane protein TolC
MQGGFSRALRVGTILIAVGAWEWLAQGQDRPLGGAQPAAQPSTVAPSPRTFGLVQCLSLAEQNHPNIWAAQARLRGMHAQLDEARSAPFTQFTLTGGLGVAPTVRGNDLYSPNTDYALNSNLGLGYRVALEGVIPLWTFGKITNTWRAAEAQIKVGEGDVNKQRGLVKLDVRKAYFGLQLSRDAGILLGEAVEKLDKALEHQAKELADGNGDEVDLLKLKTFRYELEARRSEARRYEAIALASLKFLTGQGDGFDIPSQPLKPYDKPLMPVARYLEAARLHRPEVNMLRAGLVAREAQVDLARSKYWPDVGIGLSGAWSRAPEVTDQQNPFVRDDANYLRYGAGLVLRWQLDFLPNAARVRQAQAQLEELRQTERYALGGIGVEIETAFAQVADAQGRERAYGEAQKTARRWMIAVQQGIDVGTREDGDLIDPARQWATQRYNHLTAIMDLNMAWAQLALATGWEQIAPGGG